MCCSFFNQQANQVLPHSVSPNLMIILLIVTAALMKAVGTADGIFFFRRREPGQDGLILGVMFRGQPTYHLIKWEADQSIFSVNSKPLPDCDTVAKVCGIADEEGRQGQKGARQGKRCSFDSDFLENCLEMTADRAVRKRVALLSTKKKNIPSVSFLLISSFSFWRHGPGGRVPAHTPPVLARAADHGHPAGWWQHKQH